MHGTGIMQRVGWRKMSLKRPWLPFSQWRNDGRLTQVIGRLNSDAIWSHGPERESGNVLSSCTR